jgi:hypothetical protein
VLIRDATVHTMTAAGTLEHTDILISDGKIAELGHGINAPANAEKSSTPRAGRSRRGCSAAFRTWGWRKSAKRRPLTTTR